MALLKNIDYRIQGYQKKPTFNAKGDLVLVEYFRNYDSKNDTYSTLLVKEERQYFRDPITTILSKRLMTITWYNSTGKVLATKSNIPKHYTPEKGYDGNKRARRNLINKASMYFMNEVGLENGKVFLDQVSCEIATYVDGSIQPLLDAISNSSDPFMTATIKSNLDVILNVPYS